MIGGFGADFYPRSPCGERLHVSVECVKVSKISIHALLAESDIETSRVCTDIDDFYPRSPCGERLFDDL